MSCKNEQDALDLNYTYTVNPNPPRVSSPTTTRSTTTTTQTTSINISTGETYTTSCYYGINPAGTRNYSRYFTNNESQTIYILYSNSPGLAAVGIGAGETRTLGSYSATHGANSRQYKVAFTQAGLSDVEFITRNFNLDCQADIDITHSLASCAGNKGSRTRVSSLSFTNNESETAYVNTRYSTNGGSTWSSNVSTTISAGATVSGPNYTVPNGGSIIWQSHKGFSAGTNVSFSDSDYYTENTSNTIDCPDGYYVNVDGSNTYSLGLECRNWNSNTRANFRANPWWGNFNTAVNYMSALKALTGDYDNGDTDSDEEDYFDYSSSFPGNCNGLSPEANFVYKRDSGDFYSPDWDDPAFETYWNSSDRAYVFMAELVP